MNPQNPQFPHQDDEYAQQQAEVQRQMQHIMASPNPVQVDQKPNRTLGIIAIILSLLIPPAGFILGLLAIFKGFLGKKDSVLGLMGVISACAGLMLSVLILTTLMGSTSNSGDSSEKDFTGVKLSLDNVVSTLNIPSGFTEADKGDNYITWESDQVVPASRITLSVENLDEAKLNEMLENITSIDETDQVWSNTILLNDLSDCTNPETLESGAESQSVKQSTIARYRCNVSEDDQNGKFIGTYISLVTVSNQTVTLNYFLNEDSVNTQQSDIENFIKSINVSKK